jgi:hypothetical protein
MLWDSSAGANHMTKLIKPVKRTSTVAGMPHGFKDRLVITLYPGAVLGVRESGSRSELHLNIGEWYARTLVNEALKTKGKRDTTLQRPKVCRKCGARFIDTTKNVQKEFCSATCRNAFWTRDQRRTQK